jgi:hypothetical protein
VPTIDVGDFGTDDGAQCLFDIGQTMAIDASGLGCYDQYSDSYYYLPIYSIATACVVQDADPAELSMDCIRTPDANCAGYDQYPLCE